jgi:hypothetical protein
MAQAPPQKAVVVQGGNVGVPAKRLLELNRGLIELLRAPWLEPTESKAPCDSPPCVLAAGKALEASIVLSVAYAMVGKETVVDIEALQLTDGRSLATATFTLGAGKSLTAADVAGFAKQLKDALATPLKEPAPDEPLKSAQPAAEQPAFSPAKPVVVQPSPWRVAPIAFGIGAVVVGAAAAVLAFEGVSQRDALDQQILATAPDGMHANITQAHAQQILAPANNLFTGGLVAACAAGALAVLAVVLFLIN